jgi:hypothetical protein
MKPALRTNPTAKQSALASTGKGASLSFQKTIPGLKGHLNVFPQRVAGYGDNHQANNKRKTNES